MVISLSIFASLFHLSAPDPSGSAVMYGATSNFFGGKTPLLTLTSQSVCLERGIYPSLPYAQLFNILSVPTRYLALC